MNIAPGGTWRSSNCCFAAGSPYHLRADRLVPNDNRVKLRHIFTPHLCNRNGVPYGYYEVVLGNNNYFYEGDPKACYGGPI